MLKRAVPITLLAAALGLQGASCLRADDGPGDQVLVINDSADDWEDDLEAMEVPDPPETPEADDMVVRIGHDHHRGYLGVELIEMTPDLRQHFGAPRDAGVFIGTVEKDSPAAKAGLQVGDIVTAADGSRVDSTSDLSRAVRHKKTGETVQLEVSRDRAKKQVAVTVGERPDREIRIGDLGPQIRKQMRIVRDHDWAAPMVMPDLGRVEDQLKELDKRLKDLEKRLPAK